MARQIHSLSSMSKMYHMSISNCFSVAKLTHLHELISTCGIEGHVIIGKMAKNKLILNLTFDSSYTTVLQEAAAALTKKITTKSV